jgi:hypothetical protein
LPFYETLIRSIVNQYFFEARDLEADGVATMVQLFADKSRAYTTGLLLAACALLPAVFSVSAYAQREGALPPGHADSRVRFSSQLQRIFGGFQDADLEHVFQRARPIECSDLVSHDGEWREVGFFNENRGLGNWFRNSLDEVRSKLDVYAFSGACGKRRSSVWLTTRFPVEQSPQSHRARGRNFGRAHVKVNAPVVARFDGQTQTYTFDLPYLFRVSDKNEDPLYALNPRSLSDHYALEVVNRWECKSVEGEDITYRFLICRTGLIPRGHAGTHGKSSYGTTAFSILSDGDEASSSVELTFDRDIDATADPGGTPSPGRP